MEEVEVVHLTSKHAHGSKVYEQWRMKNSVLIYCQFPDLTWTFAEAKATASDTDRKNTWTGTGDSISQNK